MLGPKINTTDSDIVERVRSSQFISPFYSLHCVIAILAQLAL